MEQTQTNTPTTPETVPKSPGLVENRTGNDYADEHGKGMQVDIDGLKEQVASLKNDINDSKKEFITILGIFASFITFVSVEFQIIKNAHTVGDLLSLSFLLLGAMFIFVMALKFFLIHDFEWKDVWRKPLFVFPIALCILSIVIYVIPRAYEVSKVRGRQTDLGYYIYFKNGARDASK